MPQLLVPALAMLLAMLVAACMPAVSRDAADGTDAAGAIPPAAQADTASGIEGDADSYALDPVHTRVALAVDHAGFSRAIGTVSGTTGQLRFAPGDWSGASVVAEVPLARLDFGDADWNRAVAARGLLDSERHPVARFASTRVEAIDDRRARIHGTLSLRGVTRDVVLDATLNGHRRHPLPPFRRTIGFSATTTLSRADFGSTAWGSVIGDAVELRIELEAVRSRDDTPPPATATPQDEDTTPP
ncbi:YceI family protein [Luteimonas sp. MC1828]|uniref:YceI family protein n=1 Tax=Luteimonas sp. MC1828 TaxID=2799787 RepID=UPI001F35A349|nr:YceI family protein [Luteimonas sp. MC1828]